MIARGLTLGFAVWALAAPLAAAPPELVARLDPDTVTVGDRVWATLEITVDAGSAEPQFPLLGERPGQTWGEVEVLGREPVGREDAGAGRVRFRQRYALTAFRTGDLRLPALAVAVPGGGSPSTPSDPTLHVESVLPNEDTAAPPPAPRPPAPPQPLPIGARFWWSLGGGLALLALSLLFFATRRRPAAGVPALRQPALAPWPELLAGLQQAAAAGSPDATHVALSLALRRYLGRSFAFPALESTSREIARELDQRRAPHDAAGRVRELLAACDRVKFARGSSDAATAERRIAAARDAAAEIEAHLSPAPPPGAPLAGGSR